MAAQEILHLRDGALSERHRHWGGDCPMIDLDFIAVEFNRLIPQGICEYKHANTRYTDAELKNKAGVRVVRTLADMAGIPAWIAIYNPVNWAFKVVPLNPAAEALFSTAERLLTESEYVSRIYNLRGVDIPAEIDAALNSSFQPVP